MRQRDRPLASRAPGFSPGALFLAGEAVSRHSHNLYDMTSDLLGAYDLVVRREGRKGVPMGERSRTVARTALWAAWGLALLLLPAAYQAYRYNVQLSSGWEGYGLPLSYFLWTSAIPLSAVTAAVAWALRDRLECRRRALTGVGLAVLLAYALVAAAYYLWLPVGAGGLVRALGWAERILRWGSWALWGTALPVWALRAAVRPTASASPLDGLGGADALSERERAIAEALATGSTVAQVAAALGLSASTVMTYRSRACEKLGVASLDELRPVVRGAGAVPAAFDVASPGAPALMAMALCVGLSLRLLSRVTMTSGSSWHQALGLLLVPASLAVPWAVLLVYARLRGMRVRPRWATSRLGLVLLALALFGLLAGSGWYGLEVHVPGGFLNLNALGVLGNACAVAALAPYLLWPRERVTTSLDEERCVLYLRGRGAGELQAHVLTEIALGRTTPEICESLHVARGTVNAYRAQGYELLGVHSSRELTDLLARDVGRVPSAGKTRPSADDSVTTE